MAKTRRKQPSDSATKARFRFVAGFTAFFATLWFLWDTWLVTPLKLFVVMLHEVSHGLAAVATGGSIDRIVLTPDLGGACFCGGGDAFLTLSAGYLGSLLWGAALVLIAARSGRRSPWITGAIGVFRRRAICRRPPTRVCCGLSVSRAVCTRFWTSRATSWIDLNCDPTPACWRR